VTALARVLQVVTEDSLLAREVLMVRVLCLLLGVLSSDTCSALEIQRVAECSGVVLRLRGDFKDGDYARFKSQFGKRDTIVGLDLSSDGGDLEDGMQIATLTRQKKLSVYVADECNSVCAFVFFAAAKRYLAHNSKIGVHSVSNYRAIEDLSSMRLTLKMARLSAKLGTPISVIGKFVTTTPANISYLDGNDLAALDISEGNPFHYLRAEKSSGIVEGRHESCQNELTRTAPKAPDGTPRKADNTLAAQAP
jgi:hypothetical protein